MLKNIIVVLFLVALGTGLGYYLSNNNISLKITPEEALDAAKDTGEKAVSKAEDKLNEIIDDEYPVPLDGKVIGKLCYPSEGIPPLTVYLQRAGTNIIGMIDTQANQNTYQFGGVLPGMYFAYAYVQTNPDMEDYGGGYTPAVACGLSVECTDHNLLEFEVKAGEAITNIDICDWYGAELPPKPY